MAELDEDGHLAHRLCPVIRPSHRQKIRGNRAGSISYFLLDESSNLLPSLGLQTSRASIGVLHETASSPTDGQDGLSSFLVLSSDSGGFTISTVMSNLSRISLVCLCIHGFALTGYGQGDRASQLISKLKDPAACGNRSDVAEELGWIRDPRAVEPLIAALKNPDLAVRKYAAMALGMIRDRRAVDPLIAALKDTDDGVRWNAVDALGKIGDPRATEPLTVVLNDSGIGRKAQMAIDWIGKPPPEDLEVFARATQD